jgi:hypothetical protein
MKDHPERIERLSFSLFYVRETVRKDLRDNYDKLRDDFGAEEDSMYALRSDMLRKGLFGEELKRQVAVLDTASGLLPEIEKKDPALAQKIRGVIKDINDALASGNTAGAADLIKQLNGLLASAGYQQNVDEAVKKINSGKDSAAGATGGPAGPGGSQALAGGGSVSATADGIAVTGGNGQTVTIPGATALGGGKLRLADGTEVDLNNSTVLPDGSIKLADGRIIKDGKVAGSAGGASTAGPAGPVTPVRGGILTDPDGNEIPDEYVWDPTNGEGKGVDKVYIGGKGARLTRETKVTVRAVQSATKANTYEVSKTPGESRSWGFVIAPVPGSEKKSTGALAITLALTDRNGGKGFTVTKWEITSPAGSPALGDTSAAQVTATFSASATYTIQVSGTTDWGSAFSIKTSLPVGVE